MPTNPPSFRSRRYADGGMAPQGPPPGPGAPQPGGQDPNAGGGPEQQVQAALQQYAQTKDPQLAVQICDMLVGMSGSGAAPQPGGGDPSMQGGVPAPGGAPQGGPGPQSAANGGKLRSFYKQPAKGEKPTFGVPSKGSEGANKVAAVGKTKPFAGRPLSADQKLKAKRK